MSDNAIDTLSVYAVRYALGRSSYAPSEISRCIIENLDSVSRNSRAVIAEDIRHYLGKRDPQASYECDAQAWRALLAAVEKP